MDLHQPVIFRSVLRQTKSLHQKQRILCWPGDANLAARQDFFAQLIYITRRSYLFYSIPARQDFLHNLYTYLISVTFSYSNVPQLLKQSNLTAMRYI